VSFRRRLTLYGTAIAGVTMFVLWILLLVLTNLAARGDQRAELEAASLAASEGDFGQRAEVDLAGIDDIVTAIVFDDGSLDAPWITVDSVPVTIPVDRLAPSGDARSRTDYFTFQVGATELAASLRTAGGMGSDHVVALQSMAVVEQAIAEFVPVLVLASVVILIVAYRASSVVARRAITPLEQIASYSTEVTETGDTSRRLEVGRRGREIDDVVASFNTMVTQLGRSRDRTAAALESQRRFVADASHELRTPLTTIRTNAAFLRDHPDAADADRDEALADIISESERMSLLTGELLDLARADADVLSLHLEEFDLGEVAERIARQATTPERPVRAGGSARLRADREFVTRLLWILVDNALVHGAGTVTIECDSTDASAVITVSDEGAGVPASERLAVFERFHRVDGATRRGSGLGLALAKEIVEAHGGAISIDDSDGAVVLVRIPHG
jgi:signal transduction histidine kinase